MRRLPGAPRPGRAPLLEFRDRMALLEFATHKFASNVLEKCLQFGTTEERRMQAAPAPPLIATARPVQDVQHVCCCCWAIPTDAQIERTRTAHVF